VPTGSSFPKRWWQTYSARLISLIKRHRYSSMDSVIDLIGVSHLPCFVSVCFPPVPLRNFQNCAGVTGNVFASVVNVSRRPRDNAAVLVDFVSGLVRCHVYVLTQPLRICKNYFQKSSFIFCRCPSLPIFQPHARSNLDNHGQTETN
jgi:hypothetical protein